MQFCWHQGSEWEKGMVGRWLPPMAEKKILSGFGSFCQNTELRKLDMHGFLSSFILGRAGGCLGTLADLSSNISFSDRIDRFCRAVVFEKDCFKERITKPNRSQRKLRVWLSWKKWVVCFETKNTPFCTCCVAEDLSLHTPYILGGVRRDFLVLLENIDCLPAWLYFACSGIAEPWINWL